MSVIIKQRAALPSDRAAGTTRGLEALHSPLSAGLSREGDLLVAFVKVPLPEREGWPVRERRSVVSSGGNGPRRSHFSTPLSVEANDISLRSGRLVPSLEKFRAVRGSRSPALLRDSKGGRTLPVRHSP